MTLIVAASVRYMGWYLRSRSLQLLHYASVGWWLYPLVSDSHLPLGPVLCLWPCGHWGHLLSSRLAEVERMLADVLQPGRLWRFSFAASTFCCPTPSLLEARIFVRGRSYRCIDFLHLTLIQFPSLSLQFCLKPRPQPCALCHSPVLVASRLSCLLLTSSVRVTRCCCCYHH